MCGFEWLKEQNDVSLFIVNELFNIPEKTHREN